MQIPPDLEQLKVEVSKSIPQISEDLVAGIAEGFMLRRMDLQNYYIEKVIGENALLSFDWNINLVMTDSNMMSIGKPVLLLELELPKERKVILEFSKLQLDEFLAKLEEVNQACSALTN